MGVASRSAPDVVRVESLFFIEELGGVRSVDAVPLRLEVEVAGMQASTNTRRTPARRAGRSRPLAVLAALLVSLFVLLEGVEPTRAIVGGTEVKPDGKYFFVVALLYGKDPSKNPRRNVFCGGTLIDKDSVLTAAHCIRKHIDDPDLVRHLAVIVGATQLGVGQGVVRDVAHFRVHDRFNLDPKAQGQDMNYDAAVLTLNQPVPNPETIHLATSSQNSLEKPGRKVTVAGWGSTKTGGKVSSQLHEVQVPIRGDLVGDNQFIYEPKLMIVAGEGGKGNCYGDSGGPLFDKDNKGRYTQIGIVSWGAPSGCGELGKPDVYAEVNNPSMRGFITWAASQ